jgi:hypothetical protein
VAKQLLPNRWIAVPIYLIVSLLSLGVAVLALGWLEDLGARRLLQLLPAGLRYREPKPQSEPS